MKPEPVPPPDDADAALLALLAALRRARPSASLPDPVVLARWLEGRASAEEHAALETVLRDDPDLRRAFLAARGGAAEAVSPDDLRRLEALVPERAEVVEFPRLRWRELVACAAAAAIVAWPAWTLGRRLAEARDRAEQRELARLLGGNPLSGGER